MVRTISGVCFLLAMILAIFLLLDISITFLPRVSMAYGVIGLGCIGIILNLLNVYNSKHNVIYSIIYWIACLFLVVGIGMKIMHWPFSKIVLFTGMGVMLISFFIPKKRNETDSDSEVLDNF